LRQIDVSGADIEVLHASEVVRCATSPPSLSGRNGIRPSASGFALSADGKAASFVSAGNSGAVMAGGFLILRKIHGVDRPAIAATIPTPHGPVVLVDAGANVESKPAHLLQFGYMGEAYSRMILGSPGRGVGVLSIGAEDSKGDGPHAGYVRTVPAHRTQFRGERRGAGLLRREGPMSFVCDGFVGNVAIKTMEGWRRPLASF